MSNHDESCGSQERSAQVQPTMRNRGSLKHYGPRHLRLRFAAQCFIALGFYCAFPLALQAQDSGKDRQPGTRFTEEQIKASVLKLRAGPALTPQSWPNGARVAVSLSWDVDNESFNIAYGQTEPIRLSSGEYGAKEGMPRILKMLDRQEVPASFYIPATIALLYPEIIDELKKRPQHEIGVHGWIHESTPGLVDRAEEERLMSKTMSLWKQLLGKQPVGYRAPFLTFSEHTLDILRAAGFKYDSSALAMDQPYELLSDGKPTGIVELPASWILDDAPHLAVPGGVLPSPELLFQVYKDEFDVAYQERTLFVLTMHPMISGRRSRLMYVEKLIEYMKSKPGVWFATGEQIAAYVTTKNRALNSSNNK